MCVVQGGRLAQGEHAAARTQQGTANRARGQHRITLVHIYIYMDMCIWCIYMYIWFCKVDGYVYTYGRKRDGA